MKRFGLLALLVATLGAGCVTERETVVLGDLFDSCRGDFDCLPDLFCFQVDGPRYTSGVCSYRCIDDLDCGQYGACYSVSGAPQICHQWCRTDRDCFDPTFYCTEVVGVAIYDALCLP